MSSSLILASPQPVLFGGSGFIGSHVAEQACASGLRPATPVRTTNAFLTALRLPQTIIDFNDDRALIHSIAGHKVVYSCLANPRRHQPLATLRDVEVHLTKRLIRAAATAGARRFVLLSTVMVYGFTRPPRAIDECWPPAPDHPYTRIALEREQQAHAAADAVGIELVIVRPSNVLGQRDHQMMRLLEAFRRGFFPLFGREAWQFSAIDARDLGRAILFLGQHPPAAGQTWLVSGYDTSWRALHATLQRITGRPAYPLVIPRGAARALGQLIEWGCPYRWEPGLTRFSVDVMSHHTLFDASKLAATGFVTRYGLEDSLRAMTKTWQGETR